MAERALPAGVGRRRVVFGLLDADGWTWAGLKALVWFLVMILVLAYIPDRAYYFVVSPTVDVGFNIVPIVSLCPPDNATLPCPPPKGAVIPWQGNPAELSLPEARAQAPAMTTAGRVFLIGGKGPQGAATTVFTTTVTADGNFAAWSEAAPLPGPLADTAVVTFSGTTFVIGGSDAGGTPTDQVLEAQIDSGKLTGWKDHPELKLPQPLSAAVVLPAPNGLWLIGGRGKDGSATRTVYQSITDTQGKLGHWTEFGALPLPYPRAGAVGLSVGNFLYVIGGNDQNGPQSSVFRLELTTKGEPARDPDTNAYLGWAVSPTSQALPHPRTAATGFVSNGTLYVIGGRDETGAPTASTLWAIASANGDLTSWAELAQMNLPAPRSGAGSVVAAGHAYVIGGDGGKGPTLSTFRADLAPRPPFFALGLFGATIPALAIKGEVGQQLGYLVAASAGIGNFVILILIGIALSHRRQTWRLISRISGGRIRPPREDAYFD